MYDAELIENPQEQEVDTEYGKVTATIGTHKGRKIAFLQRHGKGHSTPPHLVNFRANIAALKKLGVKWVFATNACGSLKEEYKPGDIVIIDQFIDRTSGRPMTFFDKDSDKVCHISVAEPFCPDLRKRLIEKGKELGIPIKEKGTSVCIQGPRFSTKAESEMHRKMGGDLVGMTVVPECVLAKEAALCYASVSLSTDYDVWKDKPVDIQEVLKVMKANAGNAKKLIFAAIESLPQERGCNCKDSLKDALI